MSQTRCVDKAEGKQREVQVGSEGFQTQKKANRSWNVCTDAFESVSGSEVSQQLTRGDSSP